jgi:putative glycosyltransferase (TIGR04348 family)
MRILVVTPAARGSRTGNRVTALRWAGILRSLGHRVRVAPSYEGQRCEVLVALHARKSAPSIARFGEDRPRGRLVVTMTGTDLYDDLSRSEEARRSVALASRVVVLQPLGVAALPREARAKARVIVQSAPSPARTSPAGDGFQACQLAHLREVKAPFLGAAAVRLLPVSSRIHLVHAGAPLDDGAGDRAREEMRDNPRYRWLGPRPRAAALRLLAASRVLVVTSRLEGGANVVSEAIACGVPVLSTRIAGSVAVLGENYPGYFPVGDAGALAELLLRAEEDEAFHAALTARIDALKPLVSVHRERAAWRSLLAELAAPTIRDGASRDRSAW